MVNFRILLAHSSEETYKSSKCFNESRRWAGRNSNRLPSEANLYNYTNVVGGMIRRLNINNPCHVSEYTEYY
jgi:hypothetical protein